MSNFTTLLQEVNYYVNSTTTYTPDTVHYLKDDYWAEIIDGKGDCEDYALTKRKLLYDKGVDPLLVRICVCVVETGESHAVLVVHDDEENDWVLDNRYPDLMTPKDLVASGYEFVKIQIAGTNKFEFIDTLTK